MFRGYINYQIDLWEGEAVFRVGFVQVDEINGYPLFLALFRGDDNIGQPVWLMRFPNNASFDEFGHLFLYNL